MAVNEDKWVSISMSTGIETLKNVRGMLSFKTIILLLAIGIVTLFIFSRLFSIDTKNQLALETLSPPPSEPTRYPISPPPLNDTVMSNLAGESDAGRLVPDEREDALSTKNTATDTGSDGNLLKTLAKAPDSSGEDKDNGGGADIKPDGPLSALDASKSLEPMALADGPEVLYIKVPVGRVRQAPSIDAEILFYLKKGDRVSVIDTRDGWYRIDTVDGRKGWAHGMLFSMDAPRHPAGAGDNLIRAILVETPGPNRKSVHIVLSDYHLPRTMVLEGERPRVVCDFYGLHLSPGMKKQVEYGTGFIRAVRVGTHLGKNPKIRIVVDLAPEHDYIVEQRFIVEANVYLLDIRIK